MRNLLIPAVAPCALAVTGAGHEYEVGVDVQTGTILENGVETKAD